MMHFQCVQRVTQRRVMQTRVLCRVASVSTVCAAMVVGACSEPTGVDSGSTFTADVTGAMNRRLTGTATASVGGDWSRQSVVQVTVPNGTFVSGVVLAAESGANTISIMRDGSSLLHGDFKLGRGLTAATTGGYTAGYVIRRASDLQVFRADSGSVTMGASGGRVSGTFTLYVSDYDLLPLATRDMVGKPIAKLGSGTSPLTISGSFNAGLR